MITRSNLVVHFIFQIWVHWRRSWECGSWFVPFCIETLQTFRNYLIVKTKSYDQLLFWFIIKQMETIVTHEMTNNESWSNASDLKFEIIHCVDLKENGCIYSCEFVCEFHSHQTKLMKIYVQPYNKICCWWLLVWEFR